MTGPGPAIVARARRQATIWRAAGAGFGLDKPVRPPAKSALLAGNLAGVRTQPLAIRPPRTIVGRAIRAGIRRCLVEVNARLDRSEHSAGLAASELTGALCRLEVEVAELRSRVGQLEDAQRQTSAPPSR